MSKPRRRKTQFQARSSCCEQKRGPSDGDDPSFLLPFFPFVLRSEPVKTKAPSRRAEHRSRTSLPRVQPPRRRLTLCPKGLGGRWRAFREARAAASIRLEHLLR